MTLTRWLYLSLLSCVIVYGLLKLKKLNKNLRPLVFLLMADLCGEVSATTAAYLIRTGRPPYHVLIVIEFVIYVVLYIKILNANSRQVLIFKFLLILMVTFSIVNSLCFQTLLQFPSNSLFVLSIFLVTCSLLHFTQMLHNPSLLSPVKDPYFWFSSANLFFYSITFFVFGFSNPLYDRMGGKPDWADDLIQYANLLLYAFYFLSLWFGTKKKEQII